MESVLVMIQVGKGREEQGKEMQVEGSSSPRSVNGKQSRMSEVSKELRYHHRRKLISRLDGSCFYT